MAKVQLCNVLVLDNPSAFSSPFQFELTFECIEELREDLEWKMIYVGSAESEEYDQELDRVYVGPIPEGKHMFVFQADPPDVSKIPVHDAIGVTVVLLLGCYRSQEFVRVGYFINNEYIDPEMKENPPAIPQFDKVTRNILGTRPRVTRYKINWDDSKPLHINHMLPKPRMIGPLADQMERDDEISIPPSFFSENSQSNSTMEVA